MFDIDLPQGGASVRSTAGGASSARPPPRVGGGGGDDVALSEEEIRQIERDQMADQQNVDRAWCAALSGRSTHPRRLACGERLAGEMSRAAFSSASPPVWCFFPRYDDEEGGGHGEAFNPFAGDDASYRKKEVEMQKRLTRRDGSLMTLAQSKKASQLHADNNAWEENRILTSGAGRLREVNLDFDDEEASRCERRMRDVFLVWIASELGVG